MMMMMMMMMTMCEGTLLQLVSSLTSLLTKLVVLDSVENDDVTHSMSSSNRDHEFEMGFQELNCC